MVWHIFLRWVVFEFQRRKTRLTILKFPKLTNKGSFLMHHPLFRFFPPRSLQLENCVRQFK